MEPKRKLSIRYYPICERCRKSIDDAGRGVIVQGNINLVDVLVEGAVGGGIVGDNFPSTKSDRAVDGGTQVIKPSDIINFVGKMAYHLSCLIDLLAEGINELEKARK